MAYATSAWLIQAGGLQALKYGALSANISSQEPIDVVMHESHDDHETLWDHYKQVGQRLFCTQVVKPAAPRCSLARCRHVYNVQTHPATSSAPALVRQPSAMAGEKF